MERNKKEAIYHISFSFTNFFLLLLLFTLLFLFILLGDLLFLWQAEYASSKSDENGKYGTPEHIDFQSFSSEFILKTFVSLHGIFIFGLWDG